MLPCNINGRGAVQERVRYLDRGHTSFPTVEEKKPITDAHEVHGYVHKELCTCM